MATLPLTRGQTADRDRAPFAMDPPGEFGLLLACCRAERRQEDASVWEFLVQSAIPQSRSWERVFELGEHHGVLPVLHRVLCVGGRERLGTMVPGEVRAEIEGRFARLTKKNLRLAAELIHILDCLDDAGVTPIPHKGPALAEVAYGDLAQRDFSDLDVLVPADQIGRAKLALGQIGYKANIDLSPAEERAYIASGYEYTLDGPAGRNLLELQWNFVPRFFAIDFDMDAVFARARSGAVAGRAVRMLAPEDLFHSMCVHAAKHLWGRLCWLRDLAAVMERVPIDWARVRTESRRLGVERILGVSLGLARVLLGIEAPRGIEVATLEDDREIGAVVSEIAQHIPNAEEYNTESIDYFRWMLRLRERASDRWRFGRRLMFTSGLGEWGWIKLPEPLFPLYRGVRLLRVGRRLLLPPSG